MVVHQGRTAVYRLSDGKSRLLYVGITNNLTARWAQHASDQPWWSTVAMREVEWLPTREAARDAEVAAISSESPLWNATCGHSPQAPVVLPARAARQWVPPTRLIEQVAAFRAVERDFTEIRADLEAVIIDEIRAGVSADRVAPHTPWSSQTLRNLAGDKKVPRQRKPTVKSLRAPRTEATS
ncbi:GIY-YIG nuclease family protein [Embleya sp. NPDC005971]|uniref:GIY-YIG nuclease family protein n=1 Tax=Embleya sp. NPDC005971 TaxID=3156724 RepID=UPI0033C22D04